MAIEKEFTFVNGDPDGVPIFEWSSTTLIQFSGE